MKKSPAWRGLSSRRRSAPARIVRIAVVPVRHAIVVAIAVAVGIVAAARIGRQLTVLLDVHRSARGVGVHRATPLVAVAVHARLAAVGIDEDAVAIAVPVAAVLVEV